MGKALKERVKSAAARKGTNQNRLAYDIGITPSGLSIALNRETLSPELLRELATRLEVSEEWLLNGDCWSVMLDSGAYMPQRAHETDAGLDIFAPHNGVVRAHSSLVIDTGVHILIPAGYVGMLKSKSGLNIRYDITSEGVIDAGYTGSIRVKLYNLGGRDYEFVAGDKISQLVILPVVTPRLGLVDMFPQTERGDNGFGSTGR